MKKVIVYIDGSNFYFSMKRRFGRMIDIGKFCKKLTGDNVLVKINYYIAPIEQFSNFDMYARQQSFFDKLREVEGLNIIFGRLEKRRRDGKVYFVEKATDVNLALDLVLDAQADEYDEAFLISNDGDFSGAVRACVERFGREIIYVAIGTNKTISYHLKRVASGMLRVDEGFVEGLVLEE